MYECVSLYTLENALGSIRPYCMDVFHEDERTELEAYDRDEGIDSGIDDGEDDEDDKGRVCRIVARRGVRVT